MSTPQCPSCKSENVVKIFYGYPSQELFQAADRGEVYIGGCCTEENNPDLHCRDCGKDFRDWKEKIISRVQKWDPW